MSEWISVKDRLPRIGEFCLVYTPNRSIGEFVGYIEDDGNWQFYIGGEGRSLDVSWVTHWMPLPDTPPKSEIFFVSGKEE